MVALDVAITSTLPLVLSILQLTLILIMVRVFTVLVCRRTLRTVLPCVPTSLLLQFRSCLLNTPCRLVLTLPNTPMLETILLNMTFRQSPTMQLLIDGAAAMRTTTRLFPARS